MITLYGCPMTRSVRVAWTLEELGLDYAYHAVDLRSGEHRREPYTTLNPAARVPTLVDGDVTIAESLAACAWLADGRGASPLVPPRGTPERARCLQWSAFVVTELEQPLWTIAKHTFALPEERRVGAVVDTARWELDRAKAVVESALGSGEHLAGETFTIADILAVHTLTWARNRVAPLASERLDAYVDRVSTRPALARAREREAAAAG